VLVLIIILKIRFKEAETEAYKKKPCLGQGLVLVGLILSGYLIFGSSQRKRYRIIPITTPTVKIAYT
jgi:hypothetical protein